MTRPLDRHLDSDELDALVLSQDQGVSVARQLSEEALRKVQAHVESCRDCDRKVQIHRSAQNAISLRVMSGQAVEGLNCSEESEWVRVVAGLLEEDEAKERMNHAAQCGHCGPLLKAAVKRFSDEVTPDEEVEISKLGSARPDWQAQMARTLRTASNSKRKTEESDRYWKDLFTWPRAVFAGAAVAVVCAGVWIGVSVTRPASVEKLLAQAYTNRRTVELRIPGAKYAPLVQKRGTFPSSLEKPSVLLKAEYQIKEQLTSNPEDPNVLGAKGRAEILEWQYDEAIKSLKHALDLSPNSSSLLCDLATAYVQRGDTENRPIDYGQAIEYLGQVLQREPQNKIAIFNRAIAEERLQLFEQATKDWQQYLQIDPRSDWANEARERLTLLQQKRIHGSSQMQADPDPSRAISMLQSRSNHSSQDLSSWPASLDEDYLDIAVTKWMPALAEMGGRTPAAVANSKELQALRLLSQILLTTHHDRWLSDVLASSQAQSVLNSWGQLANAVRLNSSGEFDGAARAAATAQELTRRSARAAYLRSVWEHAYALQRSQQGNSCLATLRLAQRELQNYPWLRAQIGLEHAICSAMVGQMQHTEREVQNAASVAESAGFETLSLRAYHIMGIQAASQDPVAAWRYFAKGLALHWAGAYRPFRAYQFYAEMSLTPETQDQWQVARTLMDEAVAHIARTSNTIMQAVAHESLAVDAQLAGYPLEALSESREAAQLFSALPQTNSRDDLLFAADVYRASLLSEQGRDQAALDAISEANKFSSRESQYWVWLNYYEALGETQRHLGNIENARKALNTAVYISEAALSSIKIETDRLLWERYTSRAYRELVELEFIDKRDPLSALEIWQWFSAAPVRFNKVGVSSSGIDFTALETKTSLPPLGLVEKATAQLSHTTVVSVVQMRTRFLAWSFDDRGIESTTIAVTPEQVRRQVRRLVRLCSDPTSNVEVIRESGRQLYEWFFAPFASRLDPSRTLVFEPDGALRDAPVAVFVTPQGDFMAEKFSIVVSPGLGQSSHLRKSAMLSPFDSILAVAIPQAIAPFEDLRLPYLPDSGKEAQEIAAHFNQHQVLVGNQASLSAIEANLRAVQVFHFAGHAIKSPTHSGLLLGPGSVDSEEYRKASFLDSEKLARLAVNKLDLVVLSACATGDSDDDTGAPHGLVQTFFRAGVPEVIATQWDIDSRSTRELMNAFYKGLVQGQRSAVALRSAFDLMRSNKNTSHPYYWAGFVLFGASRD